MDYYHDIPGYPDHVSGTAVIVRILDGLGFRFYWATDGLRPEDYSFRPAPDVMSIGELTMHVWDLGAWISAQCFGKAYEKPGEGEAARDEALKVIRDLRETFAKMGDGDLAKLKIRGMPFWNVLNGPLSDALTHTGQINSFRRINGNPCAGANVFSGTPPKKK